MYEEFEVRDPQEAGDVDEDTEVPDDDEDAEDDDGLLEEEEKKA